MIRPQSERSESFKVICRMVQVRKTCVFRPAFSVWLNHKLLNLLVADIGEVEMVVAVEGHAVRVGELAGITAGVSEELAVGRMADSPPTYCAVLDSNALVAAQRSADPHSPNRELVERWKASEFTFLFSPGVRRSLLTFPNPKSHWPDAPARE